MTSVFRTRSWNWLLAAAVSHVAGSAAAADWKPVERVKPYSISGSSGIELYRSIGERGPAAGVTRAIATTEFKLLWSRDYQPRGGACVLVSARPSLTITYNLPKPSRKLSPETQRKWKVFIDGMAAHERVHGAQIVAMVREIEQVSIGLTVPDDPGCRKIRRILTEKLAAISAGRQARSRDFDRTELSEGGPAHQLILSLVNP